MLQYEIEFPSGGDHETQYQEACKESPSRVGELRD